MKRKITAMFEPLGLKVKTETGKTIFEIARENGVAIRSECGGKGNCGKCKIIVRNQEAVGKPTDAEKKHLTESENRSGLRLACLTTPQKSLVLVIPRESRITTRKIQLFGLEKHVKAKPNVKKFYLSLKKPTLEDAKPDLERLIDELKKQRDLESVRLEIDHQTLKDLPQVLRNANWKVTATILGKRKIITVESRNTLNRVLGLAIDVGTSKIVTYVVDLTTGRVLGTGAIENPQMMYGEDIISRITYTAKDGKYLKILQLMVVNGTNEAIIEGCREANVNPENIYEAVFVGNTAMHHLFFGIQPKYVSLSPYTPTLGRSICVKAGELGVKINPNAMVCSLPIIGGFIGPDAVADVLATGMHEADETSLLLDIGTNTEVFLGNKNLMQCCSCASGPAFEGIHVKHGVKAVDGAIEKVRIAPSSLNVEYKTINDAPPVGICGTGMIDAAAEMLKNGIINTHGIFVKTLKNPRLKKIEGQKCFVLVPKEKSGTKKEIVITQKDINEIQLAKAAIFTGCSVLMKRMGLTADDIGKVFIAGAFGTSMNPENAKIIGLVPDVQTEKIEFVGNTAIIGAKATLVSTDMREKTNEIVKKVVYVELAAESSFMSEFSKALFIPHKELERFPSVERILERG